MNRPKIIAVDFDGTLAVNEFPGIGAPIPETIMALKKEQASGAKVILWTCRSEERLAEAVEWCEARGIYFDAVNCNLPEIIDAFEHDSVKVFANEYWDDRAVRMPINLRKGAPTKRLEMETEIRCVPCGCKLTLFMISMPKSDSITLDLFCPRCKAYHEKIFTSHSGVKLRKVNLTKEGT